MVRTRCEQNAQGGAQGGRRGVGDYKEDTGSPEDYREGVERCGQHPEGVVDCWWRFSDSGKDVGSG